MVWGHHMFVHGMNPYAGFAFSTLTRPLPFLPPLKPSTGLATLYRGKIRYATPLLFPPVCIAISSPEG